MNKCPRCGSSLIDRWSRGRKLKKVCTTCEWEAEPRTPEIRPIEYKRTVPAEGHCFTLYDKYGHVYLHSRRFSTAKAAMTEARKEVEYGKKNKIAGPMVAVVWPATVEIEGTIIA